MADVAPRSLRTNFRLLWLALGSYFALLVANLGVALGKLNLDALRWSQIVLIAAALVALQIGSRFGSVPSLAAFAAVPKLRFRLLAELGLGICMALAAAFLLGLVVPLLDHDITDQYRAHGDSMKTALLDLSVIAPVLEETVFRGIVLGAFLPMMGGRAAIWTSSLMFAALHLTPLTFVHHTLLGYVCARARLESGSMLLPVGIHAAYNAIVVLFMW